MSTTEINIPIHDAAPASSTKLKLGSLTALVVGSMVGSGVFSLPQNMAAGSGPLAILIGWAITAVGMLALVFVYQSLATRRPELDAGPYAYAKAGFGPFIGFTSAWGYWISAWVGNVSYAVIVFSALSYFFPAFGDGNTWQAVLGASILLWIIHLLVLAGIRIASPKKLWPDDSFCTHVRDLAQHSGGRFRLDEDLASCVEGADFIYTDVWLSMGEDKAGWADRIGLLTPYRVTKDVMASSGNPHVKFMHCLPAFHDTDTEVGAYIAREYGIDCMEVSDEVFESDASIVFDQAEILGIYILVVAQFGSFKLPLVILTPIPLTLIGIMLGHWAFGAPFSATSMIGFIALAGIIVRNSILLVDFIRHTQGTDRPLVEVLLEAGAIRFKPILLTALAAMIGAAVILTDPIFQGLAISLLFGLASSTLLTVLVIPAIYVALRSRRPVEIQPTLTDPDL